MVICKSVNDPLIKKVFKNSHYVHFDSTRQVHKTDYDNSSSTSSGTVVVVLLIGALQQEYK